MNASNVLMGVLTGIPLMAMVGPVALLLIEQGMRHGFVGGLPAVAGVATTDLSFSVGAAVAGAGAARVLEPAEGALHLLAFAVLAVLAAHTWNSARRDLAAPTPQGGPAAPPIGGHLSRAATFFAVTAGNPLTVVVFASLVLSGKQGIGSSGWVLGMTIASALVSTAYIALGHGLGLVLRPGTAARLRMAGAIGILGLALWFAFA